MSSSRRTVHPAQQPLKPAIALAILTLVKVVMTLLAVLVVAVLAATGVLEGLAAGMLGDDGQGVVTAVIVFALVVIVIIGASLAVQLASIVLGILVIVRGDGKLRVGAAILLAMALLSTFASFTVEGSFGSDTLTSILGIIAVVVQVALWCTSVAGLVVLWLGIREVRRARRSGVMLATAPGAR